MSEQDINSPRPTGDWQMALGWIFIVISVLGFFIGMTASGDVGVGAMFYACIAFSTALFFFFWGSLIRAIWFLPGREISTPTASSSADGVVDNYLG